MTFDAGPRCVCAGGEPCTRVAVVDGLCHWCSTLGPCIGSPQPDAHGNLFSHCKSDSPARFVYEGIPPRPELLPDVLAEVAEQHAAKRARRRRWFRRST